MATESVVRMQLPVDKFVAVKQVLSALGVRMGLISSLELCLISLVECLKLKMMF